MQASLTDQLVFLAAWLPTRVIREETYPVEHRSDDSGASVHPPLCQQQLDDGNALPCIPVWGAQLHRLAQSGFSQPLRKTTWRFGGEPDRQIIQRRPGMLRQLIKHKRQVQAWLGIAELQAKPGVGVPAQWLSLMWHERMASKFSVHPLGETLQRFLILRPGQQ